MLMACPSASVKRMEKRARRLFVSLSQTNPANPPMLLTGARAWEFRYYPGQLGTDRTSTVIFSLNRGNMASPRLTRERRNAATVAIVGGQGEESDRAVVVRTGANYSVDWDVETFYNASSFSTDEGLNSAGDAVLIEREQLFRRG